MQKCIERGKDAKQRREAEMYGKMKSQESRRIGIAFIAEEERGS